MTVFFKLGVHQGGNYFRFFSMQGLDNFLQLQTTKFAINLHVYQAFHD